AAPGRVARIAAGLNPAARAEAVAALEPLLDQPPPPFAAVDAAEAADLARRTAGWLEDLEACGLFSGPSRRRLQAWRHAADKACRAAFATALDREVVAPAARLAAAAAVADAEVEAMEAGAWRLRSLDAAGRKLGGAAAYDRALREMAATLASLGGSAEGPRGLHRMDLVRTLEILAGPKAAAALLPDR
ncbi:hypothetical protein, partial [Paracraurococcus ruber]